MSATLRGRPTMLTAASVTAVVGHGLCAAPAPGMFGGDDNGIATHSRNNNVEIVGRETVPPSVEHSNTPSDNDTAWDYRERKSSCEGVSNATACMYISCPDPDQSGYLVERRLSSSGEWQFVSINCRASDGPVLTPRRILEEVRRVGLPSMSVQAPPETFVNYETVVYTRAATFTRTVNLLGFTVDIEATPSEFLWNYGDGATETTTSAGRPYPATDITHTWTDAHHTFHPSVDVTYQIRYRVNGGTWQTLADTITAQGPEGDVRIREATGMLTDMR